MRHGRSRESHHRKLSKWFTAKREYILREELERDDPLEDYEEEQAEEAEQE